MRVMLFRPFDGYFLSLMDIHTGLGGFVTDLEALECVPVGVVAVKGNHVDACAVVEIQQVGFVQCSVGGFADEENVLW